MLARALAILGGLAALEENYQQAAAKLSEAAALDPQGLYFYRRGLAYEAANQTPEALASFHEAEKLGPDPIRLLARKREQNLDATERSSQNGSVANRE